MLQYANKAGIVANVRALTPERRSRAAAGVARRSARQSRQSRRPQKARTDERGLYQSHPLLDAVLIRLKWAELQPTASKILLDNLRAEIDEWRMADKGVILSVGLYGQTPDDTWTPSWTYQQRGVRQVTFAGGGVAKGQQVRIPAVWDEGFIERFIEPLVAELARAFDDKLWYVMPGFGHIGNMTCQPSAGGSAACLEAGWTPEKWMDYCRRVMAVYRKHFKKTPVFVLSAGMFLRDRKRNHLQKECQELLQEFGRKGGCIVHFGLEGDVSVMGQVYENIIPLLPAVKRGVTRIGLGDDWPLWVPEARRAAKTTLNHDDANLVRTLENAFGGKGGMPKLPVTILFCHDPEIMASHPNSPGFHQPVYDALLAAGKRLKANEPK